MKVRHGLISLLLGTVVVTAHAQNFVINVSTLLSTTHSASASASATSVAGAAPVAHGKMGIIVGGVISGVIGLLILLLFGAYAIWRWKANGSGLARQDSAEPKDNVVNDEDQDQRPYTLEPNGRLPPAYERVDSLKSDGGRF